MSNHEQTSFYGDEVFPDELLPAIDLRLLAHNTYSTSLDWGATPLNTYHDPRLISHQEQVRDELEKRSLDVPPEVGYIPPEIQQYVAQNFMSRFNGRTMANIDNFSRRLRPNLVEFDIEDRMVLAKAMWGQANPAELLHVRCVFGMASVELGCLSHPYGVLTDQDKLDDMRGSVKEAILMFGGELAVREMDAAQGNFEDLEEGLDGRDVFAVKQADNTYYGGDHIHHLQKVVLVTRKRNLGLLPDGSIVRERSSFIVRVDEESGFDQELAAKMRKVKLTYNDRAMERLAKIGNIDQVLPPMIANREFGTVIPLSTTVYAFNRVTDARIGARDKRIKEEVQHQRELDRQQLETEEQTDGEQSETLSRISPRTFGGMLLGRLRRPH